MCPLWLLASDRTPRLWGYINEGFNEQPLTGGIPSSFEHPEGLCNSTVMTVITLNMQPLCISCYVL